MATKEDGSTVPVLNCIVVERQVNIISVYKKLENVLNNRTETFNNKVESLIEVWRQVSQCRLTEHKEYVVHLMDWLKLHTLNIVLMGDWRKLNNKYEARLLKEVKHCEMLLLHSNNIFSLRCRKLAEVIKDPWGNPILDRLLKESEVEIGNDELEFFGMETGYLISTRLRKLCESHCEDMALNLVTAFMRCHQMAETQNFNLNATEDQKRFILDVYIALLYKYQKTPEIIAKLKSLTLKEGLDLLNRFAHKRVNISKIWRHSGPIAHLAAQVYITAAVMKPPDESAQLLEGLLETWLSLTEMTSECCIDLCVTVRRIIQAADSAIHMYIFCDAFYAAFGSEMKTFIIELFIRALTTDMNDLERQKNEDDTDKVAETTGRLACGFLKLADVLSCNLKVTRECVLTSFSLKPSQLTLNRLVTLAKSSGYEVLDTGQSWKCKLHPPIDDSDEVCYKCSECGDYMTHFDLKSPLNANIALSEAFTEELVELSPQLCDDLVVVLSSPRYQLFNWLVDWKSLHRLCVLYLNDPERTKNIVTELKFVDIDYSMFVGVKCEPEDENINGIERGYERYLEDSYPPEPNNELSDDGDDDSSTDEAEVSESESLIGAFQLLPPPMIKSDPKVLKSLRSFRPTLKRSKSIGHMDCKIPPKVFITNKPTPLSPYASGQPTLYRNYSRSNINDPILSLTDSGNHLTNSFTCIDLEDPYFSNGNLNNWHHNDTIRSNQRFAQNSWSRHHFNLNYFDDSVLPLSSITSEVPVALNLSLKDRSKSLKDFRTCKDEMNLMSMFRREHANIVRSNCIKNKQALQQHLNSTVSSIDSLDNSLEKKKSSLLKAVSELIAPGTKIKLNYVPEGTFETVKYLLNKNLIEVVGNEAERANTVGETFSEGICNSNEVINSLKVNASNNNEHLINERIKENYRQTYSNNSKSISPKFNSNQFEEENKVVMYNNIKLFENPRCMYCDDAETKCICKFRLVCSRSSANSVMSANSIAHDRNNINDAVVHPDNIKNIWDSDLNSIEFVDSEVESVYSEYEGVHVYNPVSSSTQAELCKPLSSTPYFDHSVCNINEVIVETTRIYEEEDQICVSDDVMIVNDFRENEEQVELHIANHAEKSNTKTKMLNGIANRNEESKMSNHVKKNNYKKKMTNAIEKNNNEDKISNDVQKSNNENKLPNYVQKSNNDNKMPNYVQESNNDVKMLNNIQKRNNEDKMPSRIQNSNIENKLSNDIQNRKNGDKIPNDIQKRNNEDKMTNDVQKSSNNENKMSDVIEKSNDESKILNNVQKSNNENKMPNWCDVSLEEGNLKVTFPDGVENVDKDVNIKTFSNDDDSSLQKTPFKNKKHKINRNRKVPKNSVDKKISKTIPTAIAKKIESNYQKISKKKSRRSNKSKKRIKRLDSSQDEYVPGVKVNIKSTSSVFLRKYVKVKDRNKIGLIDLVKKYKLKEARVVLHRLTWPVISDNKGILKYNKQNVQKEMSKFGHKKATKKSENMNKSGCRGKDMQRKCKGDLKPWPLQDISPKVNRYKDIKPNVVKGEKCNKNLKTEVNSMNPRVVLKRLDFDKDRKRNITSVLAKVPGLNDLQMIRPSSVDRIVQVVQVPGARPTNIVPIPNSTQVTPHIQRIGQPRMEKPISTDAEQTATTVTVGTSANATYISESSPSINILSQQIIRPGNQNCVNLKPRTSPLINILSQQIIKPATVSSTKVTSSSGATESQLNNAEAKSLPNSIVYPYQNKVKRTQVGTQRLDRELHLLSLQRKQAALERELRLQKSLSEECEDLGVDEPSASDLFPEADLFFDCNHSPSFDQSSQDLVKRVPVAQEIKEESRSIGIFCDDEPMRTDFLFEPIEYRAVSVDTSYDRNRDLRNGQNNAQSDLTCEDNTLLQTCTSMSDVTIPSPISPEPYADLSSPAFSKRRYSYSNRKKIEKNKQTENWPNELSSSEDTTGSAEMINSTSHSPEPFHGKRDQNLNCNEELYSFRVVERYPLKDDQECEENDCDGVTDCTSGRSVRRSVRKTCNCCNGIVKLARTRPSRPPSIVSQSHLRPSRPPSRPASPIKKTVVAKKR